MASVEACSVKNESENIVVDAVMCVYLTEHNGVDVITYLLTPWCRVLLEKLTGLQLVKKFPAFHGIPRFIAALTSLRHPSLSWANPIQSIYPHPTSRRSVLIFSTHLRLGLPIDLFPSGFPTKILYAPLSSPIHAIFPAHHIPLSCIKKWTSQNKPQVTM